MVTTSARNVALAGRRGRELQKFGQRGCPGLMHGRAHGHLHGFQIPTPRRAAGVEDDAQQLVYFTGDFLLDDFDRFFSCADCLVSSTGRNWQISSFTSNS